MTNVLTLADYLQILRRRLPLILGLTFAAVVAAIVLSFLTTPQYRTSASILINQNSADDIYDPVTGVPFNQAERVAANELRLMQSTLVTNATSDRLGFAVGNDPEDDVQVSARVEASADVLVATATDSDPERAQLTAQTYAETYLDIRRDQFVAERLETAEKLSQRIQQADDEIAELQADGASDADIRREVALRDDLADSFDRLQITADLGTSGRGQIIDEAEFPIAPFTPQTARNVAAAATLGLMLGAAAALVLHSLDRTLKSREAVEAASGGIPVLGMIPRIDSGSIDARNQTQSDSEIFRSLRASIEFAFVDRPIKVLQVTSPGPSAGKTTIAGNLAVVMAQSGKQVAVIDGDLRRPRLHTVFSMSQEPGLTSVLIRKTSAETALRYLDAGNGTQFGVMPSGPIPPGPSELLGSQQAEQAFAQLRDMVDIIIVDSAPVLPVSDALVLSRLTDATIVVANATSTKRDELTATLERLDHAGANVIGTILNQVKRRRGGLVGYGYGSDYGYGYGSPDEKTSRLSRKNSAPRHAGTVLLDSNEMPTLIAGTHRNGSDNTQNGSTPPSRNPRSGQDSGQTPPRPSSAFGDEVGADSRARSAQRPLPRTAQPGRRNPNGSSAKQASDSRQTRRGGETRSTRPNRSPKRTGPTVQADPDDKEWDPALIEEVLGNDWAKPPHQPSADPADPATSNGSATSSNSAPTPKSAKD